MSVEPNPLDGGVDLGTEPTLIIQTIIAILNAVQIGAINMSTLAHTIVACVTIGLGAILNRQAVVPVRKVAVLRRAATTRKVPQAGPVVPPH